MSNNNKIKLGLALSGGGARGLAHIGVLKALTEAGIKIDFLAGTSMGGVIAAGYASGLSSDEMEQIAQDFASPRKLLHMADLTVPRKSVFQGDRLLTFSDTHLPCQPRCRTAPHRDIAL